MIAIAKQDKSATAHLARRARLPFGRVPLGLRRQAYGVPYVQLEDETGGQLWVTRHGWRHLRHLDPSRWFLGQQYSRRGVRLSQGSGAVYRVASEVPGRPSLDLVVKFSRVAQDVPLTVAAPGMEPDQLAVERVSFNDPFQEFGLLEELRTSSFGPADLRVLTKRPLAIYSPARHYDPWQLGRVSHCFRRHDRQLNADQACQDAAFESVQMSIDRQYVVLFHWVRGEDAEQLVRQGVISSAEAAEIVAHAVHDMAAKGFRMLDVKPNHVILRNRGGQGLLRRNGRLVYAMVDFELLQRTAEYEAWRAGGDRLSGQTPPQFV